MGCTCCCGTREWRDLPDAHATGRTQCILSSRAPVPRLWGVSTLFVTLCKVNGGVTYLPSQCGSRGGSRLTEAGKQFRRFASRFPSLGEHTGSCRGGCVIHITVKAPRHKG